MKVYEIFGEFIVIKNKITHLRISSIESVYRSHTGDASYGVLIRTMTGDIILIENALTENTSSDLINSIYKSITN